jgi:hypothetical protein
MNIYYGKQDKVVTENYDITMKSSCTTNHINVEVVLTFRDCLGLHHQEFMRLMLFVYYTVACRPVARQ